MNSINSQYAHWFSTIVSRYYQSRGFPTFDYALHSYFVTMMCDRRAISQRKSIGGILASDTSHEFDAFHSLYRRMAKVCSSDHVDRSPFSPLAIVGADQEGSRSGQVEWSGTNLHIHAMVFGHPDCRDQLLEFAASASTLPGQVGLEMASKIEFRPFDPAIGVTDYVAKALSKSFYSPHSSQLLRIYPNPNLGPKLKYKTIHPLPQKLERIQILAQREVMETDFQSAT